MNTEHPLRNQAILIAGSPGAGKSTLSAFLARQLTLREIPVRLFHEHDFAHVDVMARFRKEWYFGDPNTISSWIEANPAFFGSCLASGEVWILDALYPGFFALLGLYSPAEVAAFADELATLLQPVRPLIVYLSGDPRVFMGRAVARRGTGWRDAYARYVQNWHLERYPGGPIGGVEDVIRLFEWRHRHSLELLARWPGETLILDALGTPLEGIERALLERIGIEEIVEDAIPPEVLQGYTAAYAPDNPDAPPPLIVDLVDGYLRVNAYWDDGCPSFSCSRPGSRPCALSPAPPPYQQGSSRHRVSAHCSPVERIPALPVWHAPAGDVLVHGDRLGGKQSRRRSTRPTAGPGRREATARSSIFPPPAPAERLAPCLTPR